MPARAYIGIVFQFHLGGSVRKRMQRVPTCDAGQVLFRVVSQRLSRKRSFVISSQPPLPRAGEPG